jgi:DNA replication protein DnaC
MNLQHERIAALCDRLNLPFVAQSSGALAQAAARDAVPYSDFLEALLKEEAAGRNVRKTGMMTRLAGFPAVKTLDEFSFDFAKGVKRSQIDSGRTGLRRAQRKRGASAPAALARRTWRSRSATRPRRPASRRAS